jgi:hypothetical protein
MFITFFYDSFPDLKVTRMEATGDTPSSPPLVEQVSLSLAEAHINALVGSCRLPLVVSYDCLNSIRLRLAGWSGAGAFTPSAGVTLPIFDYNGTEITATFKTNTVVFTDESGKMEDDKIIQEIFPTVDVAPPTEEIQADRDFSFDAHGI